ncbi:MAG: hypothetical protein GF353_15310 [Candidatus Lokiarchaeota archaeon]|nr:hypothetical protein [Candidatus Lokiarchaeota archaeon]
MNDKESAKPITPTGKSDPELSLDIGTFVFLVIGLIFSWINMLFIMTSLEIMAYLSIIFTTSVPGIIIGYKNRFWGYGYMLGFAMAGLPFMIFVDIFIGGYVFATALFILIIMWLVFWKTWRTLRLS